MWTTKDERIRVCKIMHIMVHIHAIIFTEMTKSHTTILLTMKAVCTRASGVVLCAAQAVLPRIVHY